MKQLDVPDEIKVDIDFAANHVPQSAKALRPVLFKDGDAYCCVLGPDPQDGVFGCGKTPRAALNDWDKKLKKRMKVKDKNDEVAVFIQRVMNPSDDEMS